MRRKIGLALVALGALVLVFAPMLRWYAYPRVAVVSDRDAQTVSSGQDVEILDIGKIAAGDSDVTRVTDIVSTRRVVPDEEAGTDEIAVWETGVNTTDSSGKTISAYLERVAFDRYSSSAVEGYDQYYWPSKEPEEKVELDHTGYYFKLPFNTQQEEYPFWDSSLQDTRPLVFDGEDEIDGMAVYRFVQEIEPSDIADVTVPGSLFGVTEASVVADRMYANTRTIWVEPNTGVVIRGQEDQDAFLAYEGADETIVVTKGTLGYTDDQVAANVQKYESDANLLNLVRNVIPLWAAVFGVVLLAVGVLMMRQPHQPRRARRTAVEPEDDRVDGMPGGVR